MPLSFSVQAKIGGRRSWERLLRLPRGAKSSKMALPASNFCIQKVSLILFLMYK